MKMARLTSSIFRPSSVCCLVRVCLNGYLVKLQVRIEKESFGRSWRLSESLADCGSLDLKRRGNNALGVKFSKRLPLQ